MSAIHRQEISNSEPFKAPRNVTFGWQEARHAFSVWYMAGHEPIDTYQLTATGEKINDGEGELVGTVVLPDGFHAFHLVRVMRGGPQ